MVSRVQFVTLQFQMLKQLMMVTIVVVTSSACTNTSNVTVSVINPPVASVSSNSLLCTATTLNLLQVPRCNLCLGGPAGYTSSSQNPTRSECNFSDEWYLYCNCNSRWMFFNISTTVAVNQAPTGTPTVSNATVCEGSSVTLKCQSGITCFLFCFTKRKHTG